MPMRECWSRNLDDFVGDAHQAGGMHWLDLPRSSNPYGVHVGKSVIAAGRRHSLGLCADGTVVAAGTGTSGECRVEDWVHVVAVAAGNVHTASNTGRSHRVGLRVDGTVMATGWNGTGSVTSRHGAT